MSRKRGRDRMFKGLKKKYQDRFHNPPTVNPEVEEKFKLRKLLKKPRAKAHNRIPKKFQRK